MKTILNRSILLLFVFTALVFAQQSPFKGAPLPIPGRIEAEDFDKGGEGVAYHDTDARNSGGAYRADEGVDIEQSTEGNFNIGWIRQGEWTEYTVDIRQSGVYRIKVRTAAASQSGTFHLEMDDVNITGSLTAPTTGGWQEWTTVAIENVHLDAGQKIMKWVAESAGYNVNSFDFILLADTDPPTATITAPKDKSNFDRGEEITITAEASDPDGYVARVEFLANEQKIGEDASEPYSIVWTPTLAGKYDLVAVAYDDKGVYGRSAKVDITVNYPDYAEGPDFSSVRGFYETPFDLTISTNIAGARIKYTLDGSNPMSSGSAKTSDSPAVVRIDPDDGDGRGETPAVVVRAVAVNGGAQLTDVQTHTYIFVDKVKSQRRPSSWPGNEINGQQLKYAVNREVVNSAEYRNLIDDALLDIPTISIVTDMKNLFDPAIGIYVNATERGMEWERPTSVELVNPDGAEGFQIDAGLRIRGGWSRNDGNPKHAFRLFFRRKYGHAKLKFPLFDDEGVDEFDKVDLRCSQNYSWSYNRSVLNTANRDVFSRDVQREMGRPYTRSRYYHLYINGLYWGLYETQERSEAAYAESYFGGDRDDYDVVKVDAGFRRPYVIEATDGNLDAWNQVWQACEKGFADNADYFKLEGRLPDGSPDPNGKKLVDIDNLIDYLMISFHVGNFDAPVSKFSRNKNPNNFYAIYNRNRNDGFKFFAHDNEHSLLFESIGPGEGIEENRVNIGNLTGEYQMVVNSADKFHPQWLHFKLTENKEYRLRFADRVYKHYFNNGILTPSRASALFMQRANMIDMAIIAESARWGNMTLSKNNAWLPTVTDIADNYFDERWDIVLEQYVDEGLYPNITPPVFTSGGRPLTDDMITVNAGYTLKIENTNNGAGTIKFTLDGSDPRQVGGGVSPSAGDLGDGGQVAINATTVLKARIKHGGSWSALHSMTFYVADDASGIKITEILYKPLPQGEVKGGEYEFLELKNISSASVDLSLASLIKGVKYTFPAGTMLSPGAFLVLASNPQRFEERYSFSPFDEFTGQLDNSGEKLVLVTAVGDTIFSVRYNDKAPWPEEPDSLGKSLVPVQVDPTGDPNDPAYWQASRWVHGSPGKDDKATTLVSDKQKTPGRIVLQQNYPNPFNSKTVIAFSLPNSSFVTLTIFDVRGREVETILSKRLSAGRHKQSWDASRFAAGIYFYRLSTDNGFRNTKKLVYVK